MSTADVEADVSDGPEVRRANIRAIDGGRSIAARDVHAEFSNTGVDFLRELPEMAGYFMVAWDDEGRAISVHSVGKRNPYSFAMFREIVADHVQRAATP